MEELIKYLGSKGIDYNSRANEIDEYFIYLENLRKSGITNMFGARPYLRAQFGLTVSESNAILSCWMNFYEFLCKKFNWRNNEK